MQQLHSAPEQTPVSDVQATPPADSSTPRRPSQRVTKKLSPGERTRRIRIEQGKRVRLYVPHGHHVSHTASKRDPIEILEASNEGRIRHLVPLRYGRMLANPFAFMRGSAALMAHDLGNLPHSGIIVQACGDCHLVNFGLFATPERVLVFDLNDFDETYPAPWEWDLKRLVASFAVAGAQIGVSRSGTEDAIRGCVRSYRTYLRILSHMAPLQIWYDRVNWDDVVKSAPNARARKRKEEYAKRARERDIEHLFPKIVKRTGERHRFVDQPPLLYHINLPGADEELARIMRSYRSSLSADRRVLFDSYRFEDYAVKVVGIGSVGTRCYVGLMMSEDDHPLIIQVKEARPSVLEPYIPSKRFSNQGERVVIGQRVMQSSSDIFLGWTRSSKVGVDFYARQLRDMKFSLPLEKLGIGSFVRYAQLTGRTLASAHARSGDAAAISGYIGKSASLDRSLTQYALAYADQTFQDHAALVEAVRKGRVQAQLEEA